MEHEIMGHTKKAVKIFRNPEKKTVEKLKEILIEVLIIVFAVSFAAFIERTREHYKEKAEAQEFIIGLRSDLVNSIRQIELSKRNLDTMRKSYFSLEQITPASADSILKVNAGHGFKIAKFDTRLTNGRYDGFKSSGKIQTIENDSLRNHILKLYEEDVPFIDFAENVFNANQVRLEDFIISNADEHANSFQGSLKMLSTNKCKLILSFSLSYSNAVLSGYNKTLAQARKVESEINREVGKD